MKTIDIISALNTYVNTLTEEEQDLYRQSKEKNIYLGSIGVIAKLTSELENDYRAEETKRKGGNTLLKRQKLFEKLLKQNKDNIREQMRKCWVEEINGEPMQIWCNGYYFIALNEEYMVDVPTVKDLQPQFFTVGNLIKDLTSREMDKMDFDIAEIKLKINDHKAEQKQKPAKMRDNRCLFDLGNARYNAEYFINVVSALGDDVEFYQGKKSIDPGFFKSEIGMAYLLPCK